MKYYIIPLLFIFIACKATRSTNATVVNKEKGSCEKQGVYYKISKYKYASIKEKYETLFDSLLAEPVLEYFCNTDIQGLPTVKIKKTRDFFTKEKIDYWEVHSLAPLFINLANFDGVYSFRLYRSGMPSIRFFGGNFHNLFLLADDTYYRFTDDSITNIELIEGAFSGKFRRQRNLHDEGVLYV